MTSLCVALASIRPPKLNGLRSALQAAIPWLSASSGFDLVGFEIQSGVRSTPLSRSETMRGAAQRVDALRRQAAQRAEHWDLFAGLEGGLEIVELDGSRRAFLESWAYIADAVGEGHFGQSGAIELPPLLANRVLDGKQELSEAIDAYAGQHGIRNSQGAWGVLTEGLIVREQAFRIASINALAPFFNRYRLLPKQ